MRVALNAVFLVPPMGGMETYLRELVQAMLARADAPELTVFLNPHGHAALMHEPWASDATLIPCPRVGRVGVRALGELSAVGALADRRRADVVHSLAMTGPLASRAARVVTVPDTIWITHSDGTLNQRLWRLLVPPVVRRADRVITISEAAADELRRNLRMPAGKLDVVPLGHGMRLADAPTPPERLRSALGLPPGPIVLNVGQKRVHRNLERLVRAMATIRERVPGAQLVLPGPPSPEAEARLRDVARASGVDDAVWFPGFLDAPDLEGLYAMADVYVLPSLVEGFGLPALEAMARGLPVACAAGSAPAEIVGEAGLQFDPLDVQAVAETTTGVLTDDRLRERLAAAGRARAASYTWDRCAELTLASYRRALEQRA